MLLANKTAVVYGATGGTGSVVARAFARDTLQELADEAVLVASDQGKGLTGTIVNITGGITD